MRRIKAIRYFGLCLAWATVLTWFFADINLPIELWVSLVMLGGLLFAIPNRYSLNNHRASGWLLILVAIGGFIITGSQFEQLSAIAMLVMFPLVITGAALAELQDRG